MIKNITFDSDLENLFLPHREGIDPENYRIGKINDEILVWNPDNGLIMTNYFDDSDKLWFDISEFFSFEDGYIEKNKYLINREGVLISEYTKRPLTKMNETYPSYNLSYISLKRSAHTKRAQIHILLATIFVPNLDTENNIIVDHINRDKSCYLLTNLRWVSRSENIKNSERSSRVYVYEAYEDRNYSILVKSLDETGLTDNNYNRSFIESSTNNQNYPKAYGYYWRITPVNVFNYLKELGIQNLSEIDDSLWKESYISGIFCHPLGLIKRLNRIFIGQTRTKENKNDYRRITLNGKTYSVHRLIAEVFLNGNTPLDRNLEVDHVSTVVTDNRVENLKIVTHKENMNNSITKIKQSIRVVAEGREFTSISDCAKHYNVSRPQIREWINNPMKDFRLATN